MKRRYTMQSSVVERVFAFFCSIVLLLFGDIRGTFAFCSSPLLSSSFLSLSSRRRQQQHRQICARRDDDDDDLWKQQQQLLVLQYSKSSDEEFSSSSIEINDVSSSSSSAAAAVDNNNNKNNNSDRPLKKGTKKKITSILPRKIRMTKSKSISSSLNGEAATQAIITTSPSMMSKRNTQVTTNPPPPKEQQQQQRRHKNNKSVLLTKEEERKLANEIRTSRTFMRIKQELEESSSTLSDDGGRPSPSESEWANACGIPIDELRKIIQEGKDARQTMVTANIGLAGSLSKRYFESLQRANRGKGAIGTILSYNDLVQEGILGLMEAIERFEPERNLRFSTYATWWVRQRILKAITEHSRVIRLPAHVHQTLRAINKGRKELKTILGKPPSNAELAKHIGLSTKKLALYSDAARSTLSLEQPIYKTALTAEPSSSTLGDFISSDSPTPNEDAESRSLREEIFAVVDGLPNPEERDIVVKRFGLDDGTIKTIEQISKELGLSQSTVRMVEARALRNLRKSPQVNYKLKSYIMEDAADGSSSSSGTNNDHTNYGSYSSRGNARRRREEEEKTQELTPEQIWSM